jgi:pyruvate kinase
MNMYGSAKKAKIIVTLGPATNTEGDLKKLKDRGVDFVRVNMSHSEIADMEKFISIAKKVGIPFIVDTEGSQVRTGKIDSSSIHFKEHEDIVIYSSGGGSCGTNLPSLKPPQVIEWLCEGDILYVGFDDLIFRVTDTSGASQGFIKAKTLSEGVWGSNKGVAIDSFYPRSLHLPVLTEKDHEAISVGLRERIDHIAVSFVRRGVDVDYVRELTKGQMKIISKIECRDALENLNEIIGTSDALLIDRGDLSREVPIENIPFVQRYIQEKANLAGKDVFVATNLLETMIEKKKPTRAEVSDIFYTLQNGARGLTLAAETAIGKYPIECVNVLNKIIKQSEKQLSFNKNLHIDSPLGDIVSSLIAPHGGGHLTNNVLEHMVSESELRQMKTLVVGEKILLDLRSIAVGSYSPLEGFMGSKELSSVLDSMRLLSGDMWPLPILLDVSEDDAFVLREGNKVVLTNNMHVPIGILTLEEKYSYDKDEIAQKVYGTVDNSHPGVQITKNLKPVFLAGRIELLPNIVDSSGGRELTPSQSRRCFEEMSWTKVVGFHTRNVPHRSHEFVQLEALKRYGVDGLFVHPISGPKKSGDFNTEFITKSYELLIDRYYPKHKTVFSIFSSYPRYAGPRDALFTAVCRKNFGCSHFIVGRDHTGVGDFYAPDASHKIFDKFPDLGMTIVKFGEVAYHRDRGVYSEVSGLEKTGSTEQISGTAVRELLQNGKTPPSWAMRAEVSLMLLEAIKSGRKVFHE